MPVRIVSKEDVSGTHSVSALNTEETIVEFGSASDDYIVEGWVDLGGLGDGDVVVLCLYISVDGSNYRVFACQEYSGPVDEPVVRFHSMTLGAGMKYRVTVKQTSGNLASIPYWFIRQVLEVV